MFCFYFEVETLDLRPPQRCSRLKDGGDRGGSAAHGKLIRRTERSANRSESRPSTCADSRGGNLIGWLLMGETEMLLKGSLAMCAMRLLMHSIALWQVTAQPAVNKSLVRASWEQKREKKQKKQNNESHSFLY